MYPDVNINGLGNTKGVDSKSKSNNDSKSNDVNQNPNSVFGENSQKREVGFVNKSEQDAKINAAYQELQKAKAELQEFENGKGMENLLKLYQNSDKKAPEVRKIYEDKLFELKANLQYAENKYYGELGMPRPEKAKTSSAKTKEVKPPSDENHYRVKRGDTLWNVAKNNLVAAGKNGITKDDMNAEMERIAKLNGFESVDEFRDKFFGHGSGKEFLVKQPAQQNNKGTELNYTPMDDGGVCK